MKREEMISFEEFKDKIVNYLGISSNDITRETSFIEDLGVDSLDMVGFINNLQKDFGVKIPPEAVWELNTVGVAYDFLKSALSSRQETCFNG